MKNEEQIAKEMADAINCFGFNRAKFCEAMVQEHRTLQQNFTRLCIEWLRTCASEKYHFDDRNEASHEVAKKMMACGSDFCLPFI